MKRLGTILLVIHVVPTALRREGSMTNREKYEINLGDGVIAEATVGPDLDLDEEEIYVGGERLTEAKAAELARDIARRHGLRGGRPSLGPEGSVRVAARVPKETKLRIAALAEKAGQRESEVIREALDEYLANH